MFNDMYLPLWYYTEQFHCTKNSAFHLVISLSLQPMAATDFFFFTVSIVTLFQNVIELESYGTCGLLSDWLLSNMHLSFLNVFS